MQSFTQYLIWAKVVVQFNRAFNIANPLDRDEGIEIDNTTTTIDIVQSLNSSIQLFFADWPPKIPSAGETINASLKRVGEIPDDFWWTAAQLPSDAVIDDPDKLPAGLAESAVDLVWEIYIMLSTMSNALFGSFGIDVSQDVLKKQKLNATEIKNGDFQLLVESKTWDRYSLEVRKFYTLHHLGARLTDAVCEWLHCLGMHTAIHGDAYRHCEKHAMEEMASPEADPHHPACNLHGVHCHAVVCDRG